jgi:hypothetical protein
MLAYTNRFLALSSRVRALHDLYKNHENKAVIHGQIKNMRYRLKLIKTMQTLGVSSFLCSIFSMYMIYENLMLPAHLIFAISMIFFSASLVVSLIEINLSTKAIELELSDMEGLEDPSVIQYLKKKFDKE